jgi:hypothetical protein
MDFMGLRLTPYEQSVFYRQSLHSFGKQAYSNACFPKSFIQLTTTPNQALNEHHPADAAV